MQFAIFRQDFSPQPFLIGAIQNDTHTISTKQLMDAPTWGLIFKAQDNKKITGPGKYRFGMYGSLSEEDATSSIAMPKLTLENKQDMVEAYKGFPVVYVVEAHTCRTKKWLGKSTRFP